MSVQKQVEGWSINGKSGGAGTKEMRPPPPESYQIWMSVIFCKWQYASYILAKVSFDPPGEYYCPTYSSQVMDHSLSVSIVVRLLYINRKAWFP